MEQDLLEKIEENNELLKETLALAKSNEKKIKKIHAYMRRSFIAKIIYWFLIIAVTAGALYTVRPYVKSAVETYDSLQEKVGKTSDILDEPGKLFKDVGVLNTVFEFFSKKDTIAQDE